LPPQFYRGKLIQHVFYKFTLIVKADRWQHIIGRKLHLREVVLDELNRYMFARPDAPNRINIPLLKKLLLLRAKKLFGATSVHGIYVMNAISGRV
jgi:hypothetical protein